MLTNLKISQPRGVVMLIALFGLSIILAACDTGGTASGTSRGAVLQGSNAIVPTTNPPPYATVYRPSGQSTPLPKEVIPPAPALPATSAAALLVDDFTNTPISNYTIVDLGVDPTTQRGTWLVQDGALLQAGDAIGNPASFETFALTGDAKWSNYSVEAQAYSGGTPLGLVARYSKAGFYRLRVNRSTVSGSGWLLERFDAVQQNYTTLAKGDAGSGYALSQWNYLKLTVQGDKISVVINNQPSASVTDRTYASGNVAAYAEATGARFDNLRVTAEQ